MADKIFKKNCTKEMIIDAEQGEFPENLWTKIENQGLINIGVSENNGGSGFSYQDALNLLKVSGKYSAPIPLAETIATNWFLNLNGKDIEEGILILSSPIEYEKLRFSKNKSGWELN